MSVSGYILPTIAGKQPPIARQPFIEESSREKICGLEAAQLARVLKCVIASGHGIEAMCFFFALSREKLLDLIITFCLQTPHDRPHRLAKGSSAWSSAEHLFVITGWKLNWKVKFLATELGRSQGSIHAKVRRLGLSKRERSLLHIPQGQSYCPDFVSHRHVSVGFFESLSSCNQKAALDVAKAWGFNRMPSPDHVPQRKKNRPHEIDWTPEACFALSIRRFSNQSHASIAAEWGVPVRTIYTQASRMQLPPMRGRPLRQNYDANVAFDNIRADKQRAYLSPEYKINFWQHSVQRASCKLEQEQISRKERRATGNA